ncbi:MAG: HAD-IA family hydrolase [Bacteroidota bacterium]|nr:HAD-IA family hydrolase [Bacteroidota bacterium]
MTLHQPVKTLVLDFDGTLADSQISIIRTVQLTLQQLGFEQVDEGSVRKLIGLPLEDTFAKAAHFTDTALIQKAVDLYRANYTAINYEHTVLFPGVKETLAYLQQQGVALTIASSKWRNVLIDSLDHLKLTGYISFLLGDDDVPHSKPAPDMVWRLMELTGSKPEETMVVGDTAYDIAMGKGAGSLTCGVTYGNGTREELDAQQADYVISDFRQLKTIVLG